MVGVGTLKLPILGGLDLVLEPYGVRTDDYRLSQRGILQRITTPGTALTAFQGTVTGDPDSAVRVLVGPSGVTAIILTGDDTVVVWPKRLTDPDAPRSAHAYTVDTGGRAAFADPVDSGGEPGIPDPIPEQPFYTLPATQVRQARIFMVADEAFTRYHAAYYGIGATDRAEEVAIAVVLMLDAVYAKQVGVRFSIAGVDLWTRPDPFLAPTLSATLGQLRDYYEFGGGRVTAPSRDLTHLLTGIDHPGTEVGRAYVGYLSTSYAYGVSEVLLPTQRTAVLVSHEVGHNFGGVHERAETSPPTLMQANVCTCHEFSDGIPSEWYDNLAIVQGIARDRLGGSSTSL